MEENKEPELEPELKIKDEDMMDLIARLMRGSFDSKIKKDLKNKREENNNKFSDL